MKIKKGNFKVWDKVNCLVNKEKRMSTARNHTATHLLHTAFRTVLGEHVKQAGSLVSPERMRFDFTHTHPLDKREIITVEDIVNGKILENIRVETEVTDIQNAIKLGATALFGEKYDEKVRVVRVSNFSAELCGGTHCSMTGDIGPFLVISEGSVASGIRRIEAITGKLALNYAKQLKEELSRISEILKTNSPLEKVEKLLNDMKELDKEVAALKLKIASQGLSSLLERVRVVDGVKVVACRIDALQQKDLRVLADNIKDKLSSGIVLLASVVDGQASMVAMVTKDISRDYNAGEILKKIAAMAEGKGGGKAEMAQGGTKNIEKLDKALEAVYDIVDKK